MSLQFFTETRDGALSDLDQQVVLQRQSHEMESLGVLRGQSIGSEVNKIEQVGSGGFAQVKYSKTRE